jgi:hypothetical protein
MAGEETVPFTSHLDELRRRLIWSLLGVFVVFSAVFALWATDIVNYVKEIAVVDRDIMDEPYKSAAVARVMPYRAVGSTWTLREVARHGGSTTTRIRKYEVLASDDGESTVRVQIFKPEAEKDEEGKHETGTWVLRVVDGGGAQVSDAIPITVDFNSPGWFFMLLRRG